MAKKSLIQLPNYTWIDLDQVVMISQGNGTYVFHLAGGHTTEYDITSYPHDDARRVFVEKWIKDREAF